MNKWNNSQCECSASGMCQISRADDTSKTSSSYIFDVRWCNDRVIVGDFMVVKFVKLSKIKTNGSFMRRHMISRILRGHSWRRLKMQNNVENWDKVFSLNGSVEQIFIVPKAGTTNWEFLGGIWSAVTRGCGEGMAVRDWSRRLVSAPEKLRKNMWGRITKRISG